jgi:hypothetical protein
MAQRHQQALSKADRKVDIDFLNSVAFHSLSLMVLCGGISRDGSCFIKNIAFGKYFLFVLETLISKAYLKNKNICTT